MSANRLPGQSPGLQVIRWSKAPTAGTTTLSGLDDYSVGLTYTAGYESVYLNGVLLDRTTDYTATNGTTIVLGTATVAGDIVNVFGTQISPVNGSVPTSTYTTKGDILVATANNTVVRQAVGADGTVLAADSTQADGVKWATATEQYPWTAWTPTLANITIGNGTVSARYQQIGKTVNFWFLITLGSTSSVTGAVGVSLPANNKQNDLWLLGVLQDTGVAAYTGIGILFDNYVYMRAMPANGTYAQYSPVSSTVPFTWGSTDFITLSGSYEVA